MESPPYDKEATIWEHLEELAVRLKRPVLLGILIFMLMWAPSPIEPKSPKLQGNPDGEAPISVGYVPLISLFIYAFLDMALSYLGGYIVAIIPGDVYNPIGTMVFMAVYITLLIIVPYLVYEVWQYVKPALYPHEIRVVRRYLFGGIALFYLGVVFGTFVLTPVMFRFFIMLVLNWIPVEPLFTFGSIINAIIMNGLISGLLFQVPILLSILAELGLLEPRALSEYRPVIYAGSLIVIAWLTPDTTLVSTLLLFVPFAVLYEVGRIAVTRICRRTICGSERRG